MTEYRGRFAPTPSGPLHFGSLFAAVVSYLEAKANQGQWLLRIEDIDPPREQPGASAAILKALERHGLQWDETETYQSQHNERYQHYLQRLHEQQRLFWCTCSRKQLSSTTLYPGTCRQHRTERPNSAIRFLVQNQQDHFQDLFQGEQSACPTVQYGDVVLRRRDHLFAYQLAVVADDIESNISHVVRGIDLLESTYWQRELYQVLGQPSPTYGHFAVLHAAGSDQKLSKQNLAPAIDADQASANLQQVFRLLGLTIEQDHPLQMLQQAISQWQPAYIHRKQILHVPVFALD